MHDRFAINFTDGFSRDHPRFRQLLQAFKEAETRDKPEGRTMQRDAVDEFIRDGVEVAIGKAREDKPTLVMSGDDDRVVPVDNSHKLATLIRGSRLCVLPNAGHMFWEEKMPETAATVSAFLSAK